MVRVHGDDIPARPESPGTGASDAKRRRGWPGIRHWGARADGRWVATLGTMTRSLSVPGRDGGTELVSADALTMVTVAGTHRRRGLLRRMLSESWIPRQRGDAVAILFAAEWGIYGRFGYAPATFAASYQLDPRMRGAGRYRGSRKRRNAPTGRARRDREVRAGDLRCGAEAAGREHRPRAVLVGTHARLAWAHAGQGPRTDTDVHPAHRSRRSGRIRRLGGGGAIWTTDQRMSRSSTCVLRRRRHTETCGRI